MPSRILKFGRPHPSPNNSDLSAKDSFARQSSITEHRLPHSGMDLFHHAKEKRRSLTGGGRTSPAAKNSPKNSPRIVPVKPAKLEIEIESPPLVFYGTPSQSSGALFSGQLLLTVLDPEIELKTFEMTLIATVTTKLPVSKDCPNCATKTNELKKWSFLTEPTRFPKVCAFLSVICSMIVYSYSALRRQDNAELLISVFELLLHTNSTRSKSLSSWIWPTQELGVHTPSSSSFPPLSALANAPFSLDVSHYCICSNKSLPKRYHLPTS